MRGIIVMEGADGTGKSTLARAISRTVYHNGVHPNLEARHLACLRLAARRALQGRVAVVDRLWLSESVYGRVFRGGVLAYDPRGVDALLRRLGAVTVLCVRRDLRRHLAHFEELSTRRSERFASMAEVARVYTDVKCGHVAYGGDDYLSGLVRQGGLMGMDDVVCYDMDDFEPSRVPLYAARVLKALEAQQRRCLPGLTTWLQRAADMTACTAPGLLAEAIG